MPKRKTKSRLDGRLTFSELPVDACFSWRERGRDEGHGKESGRDVWTHTFVHRKTGKDRWERCGIPENFPEDFRSKHKGIATTGTAKASDAVYESSCPTRCRG
jgi:hypothetical protein